MKEMSKVRMKMALLPRKRRRKIRRRKTSKEERMVVRKAKAYRAENLTQVILKTSNPTMQVLG